MEQCGNTEALNRYLEAEEKYNKLIDEFKEYVYDNIGDVFEHIRYLKRKAKNFHGEDFTTYLGEILIEEIQDEFGI